MGHPDKGSTEGTTEKRLRLGSQAGTSCRSTPVTYATGARGHQCNTACETGRSPRSLVPARVHRELEHEGYRDAERNTWRNPCSARCITGILPSVWFAFSD